MKNELITTIENKLQLLITISIFLPALFFSFFKAVGEQDTNSNNIFLKASTLIIVYLLSYLAFAVSKKFIEEKWLNYLDK